MINKIIKTIVGLLVFTGIIGSVLAHEFWIQPDKFMVSPGTKLGANLYVGENYLGEPWENRTNRTDFFRHYFMSGQTIVSNEVGLLKDSGIINIDIKEPGTHLLYLHSKPSFIELDGEKFNAYLKEDGMDNILKLRTEKNELHKPSREKYERFAKTIIQCGNKYNDVNVFVKNEKMEIQLAKNPYQLKKGQAMEIKVTFDGRPLANKMMVSWHKNKKGKFLGKKNYYSNAEGKIMFKPKGPGIWMISTVYMEEVNATDYDYHSYWGSVTFKIK